MSTLLKQQSLITVYNLPNNENKLPSAANKRKFAVSGFRLQQTNGGFRFPLVPFSACAATKIAT
jgi:hypothetical protein